MNESLIEIAPLFSELSDAQRALIAERMAVETYPAGELIYAQGKPAAAMYLIKSGRVRLVTDQYAVLANLSQGSMFGDTDVLLGRSYSTNAEAATGVTVLVLRASDLAELVAAQPDIARQLKVAAGISEDQFAERHLRRLTLLSGLSHDQMREVAQHLRPERFATGQSIYRQGMPGDALYLIEEGQVSVQKRLAGEDVQTLATLGPSEFFGETAMLTGEPHNADVIALTDVMAWALTRSDFEALVLRFPTLALNLSRVLSRRLRETSERVVTSVKIVPAPVVYPVLPPAPAKAPEAVSPVAGLGKAAESAGSWFGRLSTGAKVRLVVVVLLLVWLLGIAAPAIIISLLSAGGTSMTARPTVTSGFRDRIVRVALAADLPIETTPTYTPWPTETPIPTPTFTPTATPTDTPIPTPTFTPTATPLPPTATPVPPTPRPRAVAQQPAAPAAVAAAAPAKPTVLYKLIEMRRLGPCENRGNHHIFIKVVDAGGNPLDGVTLVQVPKDQPGNVLDKMVSGVKGPGQAEFIMWKGAEYSVYITEDGANPANTDFASPLHPNFTDEQMCQDGGGGNTLFHNSFKVVFQKTS